MAALPLVDKFVLQQRELLDTDACLVAKNIVEYVQAINASEHAVGHVWGSDELDSLIVDLGLFVYRGVEETDKAEKRQATYVYIATELHKTGGHTPALLQIVQSKKEIRHVIFATNILGGYNYEDFQEHLVSSEGSAADFIVVPDLPLNEKIRWLQAELYQLSPEAVFLFNHHEDVVAVASCFPQSCEDVYYYHHADHHLALGVCLERAIHIDPHNIGYRNCREQLNKKDNIYWPLVVEDKGVRSSNALFLADGLLKTCTCAGANKIETDYAYSYRDIIVGRLGRASGVHYHVGWLTEDFLAEIRQGLRENGIDEDRFIYTRWVDSVWLFLQKNDIDLYISSFPLGGGTTTIECMGAGIPLLMHDSYKTVFHGGADIAYKQVMKWSVPSELYAILKILSKSMLSGHSSMGRAYYLKHYRSEELAEILGDPLGMKKGGKPPDLLMKVSDVDVVVKKINAVECEDSAYGRRLAELKNALNAANSELDTLVADRNRLQVEIHMVMSELDAVSSELHKVCDSTSWRITRPLRQISSYLQRKRD